MENNEHIKVLFERYLADECTPDQIRELIAHFNVSENNDTLRNLIAMHFESPELNHESTPGAVQEVYSRILDKVNFGEEVDSAPKLGYLLPLWSRIAAVWILLAVSCGITVYFFIRSMDNSISKTTAFGSSVKMQTEVTGIGERKKVTLEDGSVVWLNAKSKLTYPASFEKTSREVRLEGEAYFEVFRDVQRPFTVESGQVKTKVLGTSFNIQAYDADPAVAVTVLTGKVQVNTSESAIQIVRNQQVKYLNGNIYKEADIDAEAQIAWQNGKLQFRNLLLSDVIKTLERNYPVEITYNTSSSDCHVHADFDAETPIENVMEMLAVSLGGEVIKLGNAQYKLDGSCKNIRTNTNDVEE
ncbi:FecR family protein [Dyadobacter sp. CY323]|uniref:FecR family protein n=1 Tax=Dyadobacter sp. CY323 TaxID=2907302 RepID=UPI001F3C374E|nr:FecR domain-containing protein [Dyadobacter sp. CY323]MCE6989700.1 FecR domain-containing protein [Dyadobacter sp. CY323]